MTWQPIETAPKDGRDILLWGIHRLDGQRQFVGGWWPAEEDWSDEDGRLIKFEPTHWAVLPEPPEPTP